MFNQPESSTDAIRIGSSSSQIYGKYHPVYVLGLTFEQLSRMRTTYYSCYGKTHVGFYDMLDYTKLAERVGIEPSVVVLAEHVSTVGSVGEFLKRYKSPVLRVMHNPVPAAELPSEYYYNGVFDTLSEQDLYQPQRLHFHINLGVMIWEKNKEQQQKQEREVKSSVIALNDPRGSKFRKKQLEVPKPESDWTVFVRKYIAKLPSRIVDTAFHQDTSVHTVHI